MTGADIEITGVAQRDAWTAGVLPEVEQVRPGLWSLPVPLAGSPLRYVLVYALQTTDGVALVDAGWNTPDAWEALTTGLTTAGLSISDVHTVLITHIHPDHYGLAGRVREESGAQIAMHEADAALLPDRYEEMEHLLQANRQLLIEMGTPADEQPDLAAASMPLRQLVIRAKPDRLIDDGERLPLQGWNLRAVWTPGHSPGHLCFLDPDRKLLLSGDHVLPRITPNISVHPQSGANPLADYADSLRKVRGLDADEVLPAHEYRFRGLTARADAILAHHEARLTEIERSVTAAPGSTCWEISTRLTWSRGWSEIKGWMRRAASGETLAHLVVLATAGRVHKAPGAADRWYPGRG